MHITAGRHVHVRIDHSEHGAPAWFWLWVPSGVQLAGPVEPCMSEEA